MRVSGSEGAGEAVTPASKLEYANMTGPNGLASDPRFASMAGPNGAGDGGGKETLTYLEVYCLACHRS